MPFKDKQKQLESQRRHYSRNKSGRLLLNKARFKELTELTNSIKSKGCILCPEKDICCLDFHHVNPEEKDLSICRAKQNGWSNERMLREIRKCVVLCSNCHRKLEDKKRRLV